VARIQYIYTGCYRNKKTGKLHLHNMRGCNAASCEWIRLRAISGEDYVKLQNAAKSKPKKVGERR